MLEKWKKCRKCGLHKFRKKVVIGRGSIPADILLLGEGPGRSEDMKGEPFVGPAGRILNLAIQKVFGKKGPSYYITNTVGCRPTDEKGGYNREPEEEEVVACRPRLEAIYKKVKPKKVVFLGRVSQSFYSEVYPEGVYGFHPSYVLRCGGENSKEFGHLCAVLEGVKKEVMPSAAEEKNHRERSGRVRRIGKVGDKNRVVERVQAGSGKAKRLHRRGVRRKKGRKTKRLQRR